MASNMHELGVMCEFAGGFANGLHRNRTMYWMRHSYCPKIEPHTFHQPNMEDKKGYDHRVE
jgi:hypothetical protein